jgi:acyl carrier protein
MNILEELTFIIGSVLNQPDLELQPYMSSKDIRGWDSISHISIINAIEAHFGLSFTLSDVRLMKTIADMIRIIQYKTTA